ncbi:MAG: hypothetical protein J7M26_00520 [Armatimonadetes bacterium]|nr:hypothetical protein [Armatimonadota bacterium]
MVTLGRLDERKRWHAFVGGFQESLCGRVALWDCEEQRRLRGWYQASKVRGRMCAHCLKRLVKLAQIAEALNERVP